MTQRHGVSKGENNQKKVLVIFLCPIIPFLGLHIVLVVRVVRVVCVCVD